MSAEEDTILNVDRLTKKFFVDPRMGRKPGYMEIMRLMFGLSVRSHKLHENEFYALKDISFDLQRGEALGVMGLNGAGKSTLLKVLLGRLPVDTGRFSIRGSVGGLVELNAGFHPEMTGIENIYNRARLLGKDDKEVDLRLNEIIDFADLGDFINSPVKTYSSGMNVRLGFSIAIHFVDDLILCDEILAVGDFDFRQKCLSKINELRKIKSFVLVSHSNADIATFCDQALILHKGEMVYLGTPSDALEAYAQCSHHLSGVEVKHRIEKSLAFRMKCGAVRTSDKSFKTKQLFFDNLDFENGLDRWIFSKGNGSVDIVENGRIIGSDTEGNFTLRQEIDRHCPVRISGKIKVNRGEIELLSRYYQKPRVVKSWRQGFEGIFNEEIKTDCLWFHSKEIERFENGLQFELSGLEVEHDIHIGKGSSESFSLSEDSKVNLFGPEYHRKDVVRDVSVECNLRVRDQGYYYVSGEYFIVKISYRLLKDVSDLRIGIPFFTQTGEMLLGPDTRNYGNRSKLKTKGSHLIYMVIDPLPVNEGKLWFTLTLCEDPAHLFRKHMVGFDIVNPSHEYGSVKTFPIWVEDWNMKHGQSIYLSSNNI